MGKSPYIRYICFAPETELSFPELKFCLRCLLKFTTVPYKSPTAFCLLKAPPAHPQRGGAKNLNTFVSNSIWFTLPCRRFAATHVVHLKTLLHFFNLFCLLSLVFLAPIYANLLWNCFRRAKSCWVVGMPGVPGPSGGKLSCSRTLRSAA